MKTNKDCKICHGNGYYEEEDIQGGEYVTIRIKCECQLENELEVDID